MLRPIPPHAAWQAIAALAGSFTLISVLAAPVDLWRLTVKSHQGEPFHATATLASLPEENISAECLSMGPESDAPGSEMPFLGKANLKLDSKRGTVDISTAEPIASPAVELVLRVQCAGAPLYARHFSALIPPATGKTAATKPQPPKRSGFRLSLLKGDSVESVASVMFPDQRGLQQELVRQVIAGNANAFPDGRTREVPAGTVLWFPDLRGLRKSSQASPAAPAAVPTAPPRKARGAASAPVDPVPSKPVEATPPKPRNPITLRRALELGDKPGPQECKQLMQLCGAEAPAVAVTPALDEKARAIESGVKELHLKQEGIDQQLQRLEQSLQALQKTVESAASQAPAPVTPAPSPPKVEIRTVVKSEPVSWYVWLALAGLLVAAAIGGFAYGRRGAYSRTLAETDEQLDRMLATTATVIREFESAPKAPPASRVAMPAPSPAPRPSPPSPSPVDPLVVPASIPDFALDTQAMEQVSNVDVQLESDAPAQPQVAGLSTDVLFEMDQALDNTRSMFTDVDRFIALGRTQNALSLLQFQVHKDPKDRDSWIKLMAIYRQEKMDVELTKAAREFRNNFPNESPPAV